jgi:hypothetical protein
VKGYVEFFDISKAKPSSEGGPVLEIEGAKWAAAIVRPSPPAGKSLDDPWALCYFRQDCMMVGPENWKHIVQPVSIYGDKRPFGQKLPLGVAKCYLMARAAMAFA